MKLWVSKYAAFHRHRWERCFFEHGNPIKVSSQTELVKSLLATEAGTKRDKLTVDATTNRINSLLFKVRSLRTSGSCALNLCGIACGRPLRRGGWGSDC
ncbi:hypothetical protein Vadar_025429 [Vaccinium darrowii]|uniref:Uncharacterized protein n=1 Tax=Vaccinium darrowii TaxID=229202 RepID=A0ACB7YYI4_9ERIC|nr:hypothetical protein Vadar_025429 [Vaccinium darrowii]